jgi:septal ring factor EnvC (AmiA/AmiB activator)
LIDRHPARAVAPLILLGALGPLACWLMALPAAAADSRAAPKAAPQPAAPASKNPQKRPPTSPVQQQQSLQREQRELQAELAKLKRQLAATEASRSKAAQALAASDIAISAVNRRLRELAANRESTERQLAALKLREREAASRHGERSRALDEMLRQQQRLALRDPLRLLVEGDDPNRLARESQYLVYLSRDATSTVAQLEARRAELSALREETEQKAAELEAIAGEEQRSRTMLQDQQALRRRALDQLALQATGEKQSIARLQRDDQRLSALLERITSVLAEQKRRDEQAREKAAREAAARASNPTAKAPSVAAPEAKPAPGAAAGRDFAQGRGRLMLPVQGAVVSRYGTPRRGEAGAAGPSWKGIFIRAPNGTEVRAVGAGQVVFSDWLRGFGNLLVIDHGEQYLSVYGNNEALLRNVGDRIAVGDVVATVGNTGSNETPGLYFELRFQGRPFDPLTWVAAR